MDAPHGYAVCIRVSCPVRVPARAWYADTGGMGVVADGAEAGSLPAAGDSRTPAAVLAGVAGQPPATRAEEAAIRVLVAEDMRILRDTLVAVLNLESDIEVIGQVADGKAIVPAAVDADPDVALIDIDLPGVDGLTAAAELRERCPRCAVLILTVLGNPGNLRRALAAHVAGFLPKDAPAGELIDAVRRVAAGHRVFDQELTLSALEVPGSPLSPREAEVLRRFAGGAGPAEIAADLYLSYGTVRNYLAASVTKLGARNRVDAVRIAAEAGWL
jgi:two-component system, NarL family, response regulator DesR